MSIDMTAPLRSSSVFQASLSSLASIFDVLEDGVALIDRKGRVLMANEALLSLFGLSQASALAMTAGDLMDHIAGLCDSPPQRLRERGIIGAGIICEEIELMRPERSIIRWVARRLEGVAEATHAIVCRDITHEVDLAAAQARFAMTDPLTGLLNRLGAREAADREIARSRRNGAALSVFLLDIDHFKRINDSSGHAGGDRVLRGLGAVLRQETRRSDIVSRWGGEEFLVFLPETNGNGAWVCAERVRRRIAAESLLPSTCVTASLGLAQLRDGEDLDTLIARADERLYAAKHAGRNQCVR